VESRTIGLKGTVPQLGQTEHMLGLISIKLASKEDSNSL
jgi:hypothetical protein